MSKLILFLRKLFDRKKDRKIYIIVQGIEYEGFDILDGLGYFFSEEDAEKVVAELDKKRHEGEYFVWDLSPHEVSSWKEME